MPSYVLCAYMRLDPCYEFKHASPFAIGTLGATFLATTHRSATPKSGCGESVDLGTGL